MYVVCLCLMVQTKHGQNSLHTDVNATDQDIKKQSQNKPKRSTKQKVGKAEQMSFIGRQSGCQIEHKQQSQITLYIN